MSDPSRPLPLNALKAFEAAARHMSFSRAAAELAVTPGAVSQQIRQLEEMVGAPLFVREGRGLRLTDNARTALPLLREAFEQLIEASALMREPLQRKKLNVSVPPSFASKWLVPRMDRFHAEEPDIEVWISADMELANLRDGGIDVAIRYGAGDYPGLASRRLLDEAVLPVCSPALLDGGHAIREPSDLLEHVLLHDQSPDKDPDCPNWSMWLKARGVSTAAALRGPRFNQSLLVIEAAVMGRGVALAKRLLAQADLAAGRLVAPFVDGSTLVGFAYHVVWPRDRKPSYACEAFIRWLKKEATHHEDSLDQL